MNEIEQNEMLARRYLLGELDDEGREQFEVRLVTDPQFREEVTMVEDELVDDYVSNALTAAERERFALHYLRTPQQVQKFRITKALSEHSDAHHTPRPLAPHGARASYLARLRDFIRALRAGKLWRLALATVVGLVLVGALGAALLRLRDARGEIARLREMNERPEAAPSPVYAVELSPVLVREAAEPASFALPAGAGAVQLRLRGAWGAYPSYRATLRTDEGEVFTLEGLRGQQTGGGREVVVNIPPEYLGRRDYQLKLSGLAESGQYEDVADYTFRVSRAR